MFKNKAMMQYYRPFLFHVIMFVSLIAAIKLYPWFLEYAAKYVENELAQQGLAYVGVYAAAGFLIPEVISMLYNMMASE